MEDYSWISTLVGTLATTAGGITETVISGKNKRTEIEAGANIEQTTKSQNSKTVRTLIIGGVVLGAIVLFGLFVWSNRRK